MKDLDLKDKKLFYLLTENSRLKTSEMAKRIGLGKNSVKYRISRAIDMKLTYHGSWKGISGLGLDLLPDHPAYTRNGVCHVGLGEKEDIEVHFADLSKAFEYAVDGCNDPRGGVIYGVNPHEAGLRERGKGYYVSQRRVSREHIRLVMIPGWPSTLDRIMEIGRKTKEMLPNAEVVLYQYPSDIDFGLPLRLWGVG